MIRYEKDIKFYRTLIESFPLREMPEEFGDCTPCTSTETRLEKEKRLLLEEIAQIRAELEEANGR